MSTHVRLYNALFQRNSVYISTIFATAFGFSIGFDMLTSNIYDRLNQGKQWKDIRDKYTQE